MKKLILANPRGFCAGVTRAIEIVEKALELWGAPIYVKHEIVHNRHVVEKLRERGAVFVEELDDVPPGAHVIFSAHGVPPSAFEQAESRGLHVTDATCPLVTKVHRESSRFARQEYEILYIGHRNHVEAIGTQGVSPEYTTIVETPEEAAEVKVRDPSRVAVLTQTTLSVQDTQGILDVLRRRFPDLKEPPKGDICYATTNRQSAISQICDDVDAVLVVGATNSSNSNRLREVAERTGRPAWLIQDESQIDPAWLTNISALGMTAGASTPEELVRRCLDRLMELGIETIEERQLITENVAFGLPKMEA